MKSFSLFFLMLIFFASCNPESNISETNLENITEDRTTCSCSDFDFSVSSESVPHGCYHTVTLVNSGPDGCLCSNNIEVRVQYDSGKQGSYYNGENGCFPNVFRFFNSELDPVSSIKFYLNGVLCDAVIPSCS